jgi:nicotinamide-nucleotide amidase
MFPCASEKSVFPGSTNILNSLPKESKLPIEIIAIANEVLCGMTVNTNAAFISEQLSLAGWTISRHTTLPDDPAALEEGLKEALERSSLVITTGGLGPTCDDLTRDVFAKLFDSPLRFDETVAAHLKKRFGNQLISLEDQATIPAKAQPLLNDVGTAPGLVFPHLIALPGVPQEMRHMFLHKVLPYLKEHFPIPPDRHRETIHLCLLPESAIDPLLREIQADNPEVSIGIYPSYGTVTVFFSGAKKEQVALASQRLQKAFATHIFPTGKIEEAIHETLIQRKKTLALAESCTGGLIASHLTALPGASAYFLGSLVVYSNSLKERLLGVSPETLRQHGSVSPEVASEMLQGLFKATGADYGIAVSGIAGPTGGTPEKPVGTIWAAIGERGKPPHIGTFQARGSRETIILSTTRRLLGHLWRQLAYNVLDL